MISLSTLKKCTKNSPLPEHWITDWLLFVLKKPPTFLFSHPDYELSDEEEGAFFAGIETMTQGMPLAYLTGIAHFWSLPFFVNEHTLIPRPDTERLIEMALSHIKDHNPNPKRLLDLGTGSGCIAISLAKHLPDWHIVASERSPLALEVAKTNAVYHRLFVDFFCGDWFDPLPPWQFSLIIANPPYIAKDDPHLPALAAEPIGALVSKQNGMADIAHIIANAPKFLSNGAMLIIEHGHNQGATTQSLFCQAGFINITTIKDYGDNERATIGFFYG